MKKVLKFIIIILILAMLVFVGYKVYLSVRAINIEKKAIETLGDNFYMKQTRIYNVEGYGSDMQDESWFYDEKIKFIDTTINDEGNTENEIIRYYDYTDNTVTYLFNYIEPKTSNIVDNYPLIAIKSIISASMPLTYSYEYDSFTGMDKIKFALGYASYIHSITTEEVDGVECYKIETTSETIYVDKATNLYVKTVSDNGTVTYEFSIDTVTEEDMIVPDLSDYVVTLN